MSPSFYANISTTIPTAFLPLSSSPKTIHDPSCKFKIALHHHVRRKILSLNSPIDFVPNELDDCRILYYRRCHVLPHCRSLAYFTTRNGEILATYTLYCTPEVIFCPGSIEAQPRVMKPLKIPETSAYNYILLILYSLLELDIIPLVK